MDKIADLADIGFSFIKESEVYVRLYKTAFGKYSFLFGTLVSELLIDPWSSHYPTPLLNEIIKQSERFSKLKAFS